MTQTPAKHQDRLFHPKDQTPKHKELSLMSAVQRSEEYSDLFIKKHMTQHQPETNSSGRDSAVHLRLTDKGLLLEDTKRHIVDRKDRWFERGVKEAV